MLIDIQYVGRYQSTWVSKSPATLHPATVRRASLAKNRDQRKVRLRRERNEDLKWAMEELLTRKLSTTVPQASSPGTLFDPAQDAPQQS
jgi:hypothetical protein